MQPTSTSQFSDQEPPQRQPQAQQPSKINTNFIQRTRWTIVMIVSFILIMAAGHFYCCLLILFTNIFIFKEVNSIKRDVQKEQKIPLTPFISWYFFFIINYFCLGLTLIECYPWIAVTHPLLNICLTYHNFISFCGLVLGMVFFVLSLKQGYLRYQFRLFGWMVLASILVCLQSWLGVQTILKAGIFWFVVPALLIVVNDIFAYLVGYFFGKTKLIDLSPKKTWEGFIGGGIFTILFSFILVSTLSKIPGFMCPMDNPTIIPFKIMECQINLGNTIKGFEFISLTQTHLHILIITLFASTIGPFGGFFASGLKRAMKIKDFSDLIPGHGGVSDRMDCQMMMLSFVYFYMVSFFNKSLEKFGVLLAHLSVEEQRDLYNVLKNKFDLSQ